MQNSPFNFTEMMTVMKDDSKVHISTINEYYQFIVFNFL